MNESSTDEMLDKCAEAMFAIAGALNRLGLDDASTRMGAIEVLAKEIKEGSERIESGLRSIANAINHHSNRDDY